MRKPRLTRRKFIAALVAAGGGIQAGSIFTGLVDTPTEAGLLKTREGTREGSDQRDSIQRKVLVNRHCPVLRKLDPSSPLSLGNGEFAFTADITGLQTFPQEYESTMPLCTMSQWGWHTFVLPKGLDPGKLRLTPYDSHGRSVGYHTSSEGQTDLYDWLRENPHRLNLGRIGLRLVTVGQREAQVADVHEIDQKLDLWTGILTSQFKLEGKSVTIRTSVHPVLDLLAVAIESSLINDGRVAVRLAFPYGSSNMQASDWLQPMRHETRIVAQDPNHVELQRSLDGDNYRVAISWTTAASFATEDKQSFLLTPDRQNSALEFSVMFAPRALDGSLPGVAATFAASGV